MNQQIKLVKRFLLIATSAIATSLLANSPSQAATIALSDSFVILNEFSQNPIRTGTDTKTNTNTVANGDDGSAIAIAQAQASFLSNPLLPADTSSDTDMNINQLPMEPPADIDLGLEEEIAPLLSSLASPAAYNTSSSIVTGFGKNNSGRANSEATVIGDFFVNAGTSFSFDFITNLNLYASVDDPITENAAASGDILLALVNPETDEVLDFFLATGKVDSKNQDVLDYLGSSNISLEPLNQQTDFGSNQESADLIVQGSLKRDFEQDTNVRLVEFKRNQAEVAVPEPLTISGSLLSGCFLLIAKRRRKANS